MANLLYLSTLANNKVPKNYTFLLEKRPVLMAQKADIPIIDLHNERNIEKCITKAFQDYGVFQLINHGIRSGLTNEAMEVFEEFFKLSYDEKSKVINSNGDPKYSCKLYTSSFSFDAEEIHFWRNALKHPCSPLEVCIKYWPQKPLNYRETISAYTIALNDLGSKILELTSEGLGLESQYFLGPLSEDDNLTINHYPPCPDPCLTLGLAKHTDPNLITILHQGHVSGLQLFKDGQWLNVDPLPDSLLVMVGNQLKIISNGKLKSAVHRAVTNPNKARISAAFFINPSQECIVEPAKKLTKAKDNPPLFKPFLYKDFFKYFTGSSAGDPLTVLEHVKINY